MVSAGQQISIDSALKQLVERGYAEVDLVEEAGTFARRGGVVDVFPAGVETPTRIEFFGNEIESLRAFDFVTQRSSGPVDSLTVQPMAALTDRTRTAALEHLLTLDTSGMSAEAQTMWLDDLARLEAGATIDDVAVFAPYLMSEACSLVDLLPREADVYIDAAQQTWELVTDLFAQANEVQASLVSSGNLPPGLIPALTAPHDVEASIRGRRCVELSAGTAVEDNAIDLSGLFTPAHMYAGRLRSFQKDMIARATPTTIVASQQHERVRELLADVGTALYVYDELPPELPTGACLVHSAASQGWVLSSAGLSVVTDHEIFGRALTRPVVRKPRRAREAFFTDFLPATMSCISSTASGASTASPACRSRARSASMRWCSTRAPIGCMYRPISWNA